MIKKNQFLQHLSIVVLYIVALFYAYGAIVHILNIFSLTGFSWLEAPIKWQTLDFVYLILDSIVIVGFFFAWTMSYFAFYIAAVSQIILYTIFRDWIIDVPEKFAVSSEQVSYLDSLVLFHSITLLCVTAVLWLTHKIGLQRTWLKPRR